MERTFGSTSDQEDAFIATIELLTRFAVTGELNSELSGCKAQMPGNQFLRAVHDLVAWLSIVSRQGEAYPLLSTERRHVPYVEGLFTILPILPTNLLLKDWMLDYKSDVRQAVRATVNALLMDNYKPPIDVNWR